MGLASTQIKGLGIALNEATLIGLEIDREEAIVGASVSVLTLPATADSPRDETVLLVLSPVGRIVAHHNSGAVERPEEALTPDTLPDLVRTLATSPGASAIYGWEFVDCDLSGDYYRQWWDKRQLDVELRALDGRTHTLTLWQEIADTGLDLVIWFDNIAIHTVDGKPLGLDDFVDGGRRWWTAFGSGDKRTRERERTWLEQPIPLSRRRPPLSKRT